MDTFSHRSYDRRKLLKVLLLRGQERRPLEEGNYVRQKILTPSDDVDQSTVLSSIGLDVAASSEPLADQPEHLAPVSVLADVELWNKLKAATARWITVDGDCKAALAIYVARDVAIQPFLLIVRTRHIVTVPPAWDGTRSAGYTGFPAYSRIYRQQRKFTVSRRSEPSSRTALMGEQPNPWEQLHPQDATSRHRGAKPGRRCGLLGPISLLSPEYLLSVERRHFHLLPPDH